MHFFQANRLVYTWALFSVGGSTYCAQQCFLHCGGTVVTALPSCEGGGSGSTGPVSKVITHPNDRSSKAEMPVRVLRLKLTKTSVCEKTREGTLSFSSDPEVSDKPHLRTRHVCLIVIGFAVKRILIAIFCCICVFGYLHGWRKEAFASYYGLRMTPEICPQFNALTPQKNAVLWDSLSVNISSPEFKTRAIDWLSGAVRIP